MCRWPCDTASSSPGRRSPTTGPGNSFTRGSLMLSNMLIDCARRRLPIAVGLLLALAAGGCQSVRVAPIAAKAGPTTVAAANTPAGQLDFWYALNDQPLASNDDAFH